MVYDAVKQRAATDLSHIEVDAVDFDHMAALVEASIEAVRFLADGPTPDWVEGGMEGLTGG